MVKTTKWDMEPEQFIAAVENDEYGQITLETGDTLMTDWGGDGTFNPYVEPNPYPDVERREKHREEREIEVAEAIEEIFDVRVRTIEWDNTNNVFVPYMDKPTDTR